MHWFCKYTLGAKWIIHDILSQIFHVQGSRFYGYATYCNNAHLIWGNSTTWPKSQTNNFRSVTWYATIFIHHSIHIISCCLRLTIDKGFLNSTQRHPPPHSHKEAPPTPPPPPPPPPPQKKKKTHKTPTTQTTNKQITTNKAIIQGGAKHAYIFYTGELCHHYPYTNAETKWLPSSSGIIKCVLLNENV